MKKYPKRGSFQDVKLNAEAVGFQIKESYKKARTNIAYSIVKKGCKMVSITSSSKSEGKTITAVNIAIALAQQVDTRVLIIDCDLRRPRIQSVLEIPVLNRTSSVKSIMKLPERYRKFFRATKTFRISLLSLVWKNCPMKTRLPFIVPVRFRNSFHSHST